MPFKLIELDCTYINDNYKQILCSFRRCFGKKNQKKTEKPLNLWREIKTQGIITPTSLLISCAFGYAPRVMTNPYRTPSTIQYWAGINANLSSQISIDINCISQIKLAFHLANWFPSVISLLKIFSNGKFELREKLCNVPRFWYFQRRTLKRATSKGITKQLFTIIEPPPPPSVVVR